MSFWDGYDFWRDWMIGVLLCGALCGFLGVYVLLRRVVFVGAALTQISALGITVAFWLASVVGGAGAHAHDRWWLSPELFSLGAALAGAIGFAFYRGGKRIASETVVGLGWVVASAAVLLMLSSKRLTQEAHEVEDVLVGAAVPTLHQVEVLAAVVAGLLTIHLLFFKELLFTTFDAEMAQTLGYRTWLWDAVLFGTFGVGISFAVRTVGSLPAFGLLVVPAAAAQLLVDRAVWAFPLAMLFAVAGGALGFYAAWTHGVPTGAAIVAASSLFLIPGMVRQLVRRGA